MITVPNVSKSEIRSHYDWATPFYRLLWGEHIHHGLWNADESPRVAQRQLVSTMIELADIRSGARVLDVGCGMGGSSMQLARDLSCDVTGITLSPVQKLWAATEARLRGLRDKTNFVCFDVEQFQFPPESFDVIWSIECTEHLFDKPAFFQRAASWLKPEGKMVICAWLAGGDDLRHDQAEQVRRVCDGFLCPSLGSPNDYQSWMRDAGLTLSSYHDWTSRILRTWEICQQRVDRSRVRTLAHAIRGMVPFLDSFETILTAYRTGAMGYGCFVFNAVPADGKSITDNDDSKLIECGSSLPV